MLLTNFKPYLKEPTSRFAPSPTGDLHIGGLRSALYNYAFAKQIKGKFILRIEDTDRNRFVPSSMVSLPEILVNFGLVPDYVPDSYQILRSLNKDFGWYTYDWALHLDELEDIDFADYKNIFIQSLRLPVYQKIAWYLVKIGWAYFCFCSKERLEKVNEEKRRAGKQPGYDGYCKKTYTLEQALDLIRQGEKPVVRMNFDKLIEHLGTDTLVYHDKLLGDIKFDLTLQNDGVLLKSDGFPTYHLAVVVDDYLMNVHTTIRGYEWISSIPKHVLVAEALGIREHLSTIHLPVILDPKGGKLSKRSGSVSVNAMLKEGYVKEAILNYLMTLGVNIVEDGKQPIINMSQFLQAFDWRKTNTANPVFDRQKLLWFNKEYLTHYNKYEFGKYFIYWLARAEEYLSEFLKQKCQEGRINLGANCKKEYFSELFKDIRNSYEDMLIELLDLAKVRSYLLTDILLLILPYYTYLIPQDFRQVKGIKRYDPNVLKQALEQIINNWPKKGFANNDAFANTIRTIADNFNIKHGDLFMLVRLTITGYSISLPLFEFISLLGVDESLKRLKKYLNILDNYSNE